MNKTVATILLLLSLSVQAQPAEVRAARIWTAPDQTRLVVDTSGAVTHKVFRLDNPDRLVIDIAHARMEGKLPTVEADEPLLTGVRGGAREEDDLRLVLDLKQPVRVKSFLLQPNEQYGHRLIVDLMPAAEAHPTPAARPAEPPPTPAGSKKGRTVVIAIDAGHGGEDAGAIGAKGTREKDITLAIARKLASLVKKERGMQPVLIREGDYYVGLRKRMALARKHDADLFISIHADAFRDAQVRGSSVYTLSPRGASSEAAKWLADKENAADLIGGIDLGESDNLLASMLLEMTQNATIEHSGVAAQKVLDKLKGIGAVHKTGIQKAGFVVLKSPDIPSMLVETAFISNPTEEKRLQNGDHQAKLAQAILGGIRAYIQEYPPPGTLFARDGGSRKHVINDGETLGAIAERYAVSVASLRTANRLDGDRIRVGQVLTIPES